AADPGRVLEFLRAGRSAMTLASRPGPAGAAGPLPMQTNYDEIAAQYQMAKRQPWRMHVEHFTFFELLGDLRGKSVLDLACGEGFVTRFLKLAGAARVLGVDLSEG